MFIFKMVNFNGLFPVNLSWMVYFQSIYRSFHHVNKRLLEEKIYSGKKAPPYLNSLSPICIFCVTNLPKWLLGRLSELLVIKAVINGYLGQWLQGGWCAHAGILGLFTFLLLQDLYFTVRDGGASECAAKFPYNWK